MGVIDEMNLENYKGVPKKDLSWHKCSKGLPTECKQYAVLTTDDVFTVDLRTPCAKESIEAGYSWLQFINKQWAELPAPYYPYQDEENDWVDVRDLVKKTPVLGYYYYVAMPNGTVTVGKKINSYVNNEFFIPEFGVSSNVRAWMPMEDIEE